jgi:cytochrome P450
VNAYDIIGFDPSDADFLRWPYPHYARVSESGFLQRTPVGLWIATGHAECVEILRDTRFGHRGRVASGLSAEETSRMEGSSRGLSFIFMDPPDHTRLRGLVSKAFTPRAVERLRSTTQEITERLLSKAIAQGTFDLIAEIARPIPTAVIGAILGTPADDLAEIEKWSGAMSRSLDPEFLLPEETVRDYGVAMTELTAYIREVIELRRRTPDDSLISDLIRAAESADRLLSDVEVVELCVLLLVAGAETTINLIGNGALALLQNQEQLGLLRSRPDLIPGAIGELLRYDSPSQMTFRFAKEDVEVAGNVVKGGDPVMLLLAAANHDPRVFADPGTLDVTRAESDRHLSFSQGLHFCLGALLAKMEATVVFEHLVGAGHLELADDAPPYKDNLVLRGLARLPVRCTPA